MLCDYGCLLKQRLVHVCTGIGDKELTRLEMATILCFGDKPYSQIMDSMPERSGITGQKELFEPTLSEVRRPSEGYSMGQRLIVYCFLNEF